MSPSVFIPALADPSETTPGGPPSSADIKLTEYLQQFSRAVGKLTAFAGFCVLFGWWIENPVLMRVLPGLVAMNPMTAVCFIAAGASLTLFWGAPLDPAAWQRRWGQALAGVIIFVGALKLIDCCVSWEIGIDLLLFRRKLAGHLPELPNQMAPNSAFNHLLAGIVLFRLHRSRRSSKVVQNLSLVIGFHALLALLGYGYGASYLYGVGSFIPMALHTAVIFLLLALALLFTRTDRGVAALLVSKTPGGITARRLLPVGFAIPGFLGGLRLLGEKHGYYNSEFGVTIMVLVCIGSFSGLIWLNAVLLNRADLARSRAETELQKAHAELELRIAQRTAALVTANSELQNQIAEREQAEERLAAQQEEQRKMEEQLLRSQRMDSIGALAGGIAHDLNNALVPVLMGAQLLRDQIHDTENRNLIDIITSSGQRCTEMVNQIVTFAGGSRGSRGSVPLRHLIAEMVKIAKDTFPKSISIRSSMPAELWAIEGDATELYQILMNLAVNARDAMPGGGSLSFSAENTTLSAAGAGAIGSMPPGQYVLVSVADTGTGIPMELHERIFEPFFTTKPADKGTGLGLSTVANIVKRCHGHIQVQSAPGQGTTFQIYFPSSPLRAADPSKAAGPAVGPCRGQLILLVDDEQAILQLTRTTLENYGYRVITAANGQEAIVCVEERKREIELLITDTDMPLLGGLTAVRKIRSIVPGIPVIIASGTRLSGGAVEGPNVTLMRKPYDAEQLIATVTACLNST
jgi:signal transduction histidine kinase